MELFTDRQKKRIRGSYSQGTIHGYEINMASYGFDYEEYNLRFPPDVEARMLENKVNRHNHLIEREKISYTEFLNLSCGTIALGV